MQDFMAANPGLEPDMIAVQCGGAGNRLKEVRICFDKAGNFRACGRNENQAKLCSAPIACMCHPCASAPASDAIGRPPDGRPPEARVLPWLPIRCRAPGASGGCSVDVGADLRIRYPAATHHR